MSTKRDKNPIDSDDLFQEWKDAKSHSSKDELAKTEVWDRLRKEQDSISNTQIRPFKIRLLTVAAASVVFLLILFFIQSKYSNSSPSNSIKKTNNTEVPLSIALVDGSTVILKPNSEIIYNNAFSQQGRKVYLNGEARFDIKSDPQNPFIVETEALQTKVLGTVFNVKAFDNQEQTEVILFEGKVELISKEADPTNFGNSTSSLILAPGEKAEFKKSSRELSKLRLVEESKSNWKDGVILFERANIDEVVLTLESWYDIFIEVEDREKITETLVHRIDTKEMSLDEIIRGINLVAKYKIAKSTRDKYLVSIE